MEVSPIQAMPLEPTTFEPTQSEHLNKLVQLQIQSETEFKQVIQEPPNLCSI